MLPQDHLEKTRVASSEVQRQLESQVVEVQAELKQKAYELSHLRVVLGEKETLLSHAHLQADMLQGKMDILRERCRELETGLKASDLMTAPSVMTKHPRGKEAEVLGQVNAVDHEKNGLGVFDHVIDL
jgi:hypothetical protein